MITNIKRYIGHRQAAPLKRNTMNQETKGKNAQQLIKQLRKYKLIPKMGLPFLPSKTEQNLYRIIFYDMDVLYFIWFAVS